MMRLPGMRGNVKDKVTSLFLTLLFYPAYVHRSDISYARARLGAAMQNVRKALLPVPARELPIFILAGVIAVLGYIVLLAVRLGSEVRQRARF